MKKSIFFILLFFCELLFSQTFREVKRFGGLGSGPAQFNRPAAISAGADAMLYIVDSDNNRIQIFDFSGRFIKSVGGFGFGDDQLNLPKDIWTRTIIHIYVADFNNRRLVRFDRYMNYINDFVSHDNWDITYQFQEVLSCAFNSQNDFFILDRGENKIVKFNRRGEPERTFGFYDAVDMLQDPVQIDIFQNNKIAVTDVSRKSVMLYDFFGSFITEIRNDEFNLPSGLSPFKEDELLVADPGAKKIFLISKNLKSIKPLKMELSVGLQYPRDISVYTEIKNNKKQYYAFVIDNNDVIIGRISD